MSIISSSIIGQADKFPKFLEFNIKGQDPGKDNLKTDLIKSVKYMMQ